MKRMMSAASAALALALLAAAASAQVPMPAVDFDSGIDVRALMQKDASVLPERGKITATRSCSVATFKPGDAPTSAPMSLQSIVTQRVCHVYWGSKICGDRTLRTVSRSVAVSIQGDHALLPWETEAFSVCLQGEKLETEVLAAAYRYGKPAFRSDAGLWTLLLPAERKIATAPDPQGLSLAAFTEEPDGLSVEFADKWAKEYAGDMTRLIIEVKRDSRLLPDPTVFSLDLVQSAALSYQVSFKDLQRKLRTGEKYYVTWKFARQGKVSTTAVQQGGRSGELALSKLHN